MGGFPVVPSRHIVIAWVLGPALTPSICSPLVIWAVLDVTHLRQSTEFWVVPYLSRAGRAPVIPRKTDSCYIWTWWSDHWRGFTLSASALLSRAFLVVSQCIEFFPNRTLRLPNFRSSTTFWRRTKLAFVSPLSRVVSSSQLPKPLLVSARVRTRNVREFVTIQSLMTMTLNIRFSDISSFAGVRISYFYAVVTRI